ncbi:MAG: TetR/AcrR family transcriptional regulator [Alistipes sp.]|nr:TetR/AcrR family transcriptional regulator [Candidatus Minthomonas equi]
MVSKEHILESSIRLFKTRGCKLVTMDVIAAECGISKRTLYEQFEDKSHLLNECLSLIGRRGEERLEKIRKKSSNVLEFLISLHRSQAEDRFKYYDGFFLDVRKYYPEVYDGLVVKLRRTHFENNRKLIEEGQKQGIFLPYLNVDMVATVVSETINIIKESKIGLDLQFDRKKLLQHTMFLYLRGMSTPRGVEIIDTYVKQLENEK